MTVLERDALRALVAELAASPEKWRHLVRHDPHERTYELLRHDERVMAWLICWTYDNDTGFHDHDISSGAVAVVSGRVREDRMRFGAPPLSRSHGPGAVFDFGAADIHRVLHEGDEPAVTLHAYSPPLWRMGAYLIEPSGQLQRYSVSYAEELRPLGHSVGHGSLAA